MQPVWPDKSTNASPFLKAYRIGAITAYNSYNKMGVIKNLSVFVMAKISKAFEVDVDDFIK